MRRREFITLLSGTAAGPLTARAQQTAKLRRVGFLTSAPRPNSIEASYLSGFPHGMRELGYVEGRDYVIDWRFAESRLERFADFAAELVFGPGESWCIFDPRRAREGEDALWQQVFMVQPARRREFEPSSKRRKRRPASSSPGTA